MTRLFYRVYLRLRRTGFFKYFGKAHFSLYKIKRVLFPYKSFQRVSILKPMEIITGSKLDIVDEELNSFSEVLKSGEYEKYFLSLSKLDRNYRFRVNAFYPIYYILGDSSKINDCCKFILWYCNEYIVKKKKNDFVWYDMADAFRTQIIIELLSNKDLVASLTANEVSILNYSVERHYRYISHKNFISNGNHAIFQIISSYLYKKSVGTPDKDNEFVDTLRDIFLSQFSKSGVHLEHSPEYHIWCGILFSYVRDNILYIKEFDVLDEAEKVSRLFLDSKFRISLIGDSGRDHSAVYSDIIKAKNRPSLNKFFTKDGYVIVSDYDKGFYFITHFGSHSSSHKHNDSTTFELEVNGDSIVVDGGKYSYNKCEISNGVRSLYSHNIVSNIENSKSPYQCNVIHDSQCIFSFNLTNENGHKREFIVLIGYGVVILDHVPDGGSSCLNFTSSDSVDMFKAHRGVSSISTEDSYFSDKYLSCVPSKRVQFNISNFSLFSIVSDPNCFDLVSCDDDSISFIFNGNNYQLSR